MNKTSTKKNSKSLFPINHIISPLKSILKNVHKLFHKKYSESNLKYDLNIIDNIIYNEKSHIVATFKDRLIIDDTGEFLKRYYLKEESDIRLKKFYEYYDLYSKIFPNYTAFYEGKYLYLNIQKKQRMIDLQEKMELEKKRNEEDNDSYSLSSDSKENVFNTDAIDSILNGTNNEDINALFGINKKDLKQDEENFEKDVNNLLEEINKYELKKKQFEKYAEIIKLDKNRINKNNNQMNYKKDIKFNSQLINSINNNIKYNLINNNNNRLETYKGTLTNKMSSIPINLNYSKSKRILNSNSSSTINNNITYYSDIKGLVSKFFNYPAYQNNIFLNMKNHTNKNHKIEKIEGNLFKMKQKSIFFKNSSQNISTSNQTHKDISLSKKNSNIIYKKLTSASTSVKQSQKNISKNIYNPNSYRRQNINIIKNIETKNKGLTPLTSRNQKNNKIQQNTVKNKSMNNIKGNTFYNSNTISRNRYINNMKIGNKIKTSNIGNGYSQINRINQSQNNKSNPKKLMNNTKIKLSDTKPKIGYKEINFLKNQNSRNRNELKHKILNSGFNFNHNKLYNIKSVNKNQSQTKTVLNKKKKNLNDSSIKLGLMDIMSVKKNLVPGFNIQNFSKVLNASNMNNNISKTFRNSSGHINK